MIQDWNVNSTWSLFLDRDGVINERIWNGYVLNYEQFNFRTNTLEALRKLSNYFSHTVIVTNQQCVSKNLITLNELDTIHNNMLQEIQLAGGKIHSVFAAVEERNSPPFRRKPNDKMGFEAKNQFPAIDFSKSIMVGDTDSDIQFGKNLGMKTILIKSEEKTILKADLEISNLIELSDVII